MNIEFKAIARFTIVCLGVALVIATFAAGNIGSVDFFFSLALAAGLIFTPFAGLGMLLAYFLLLLAIIIPPIIGAYIGVQITGKDSIGAVVGFIAGGVVGFKFALSELLSKFLDSMGSLSKHDEN